MTIIDLPSREKRVTPKRPTVATPVLANQAAEKCVASLDEDIDHLRCAIDSLLYSSDSDAALGALETIHDRMKRNVDTLYTLG